MEMKTTKTQRHKERNQELEAWEARFHNIIIKNADGILIVDRSGTVQFANPAAETIFNRKAEDLVGQIFGFPIVTSETIEIEIIRKHGEIAIVEMRVTETDWEGKVVYLASLREITDRQRKKVPRFTSGYAGSLV